MLISNNNIRDNLGFNPIENIFIVDKVNALSSGNKNTLMFINNPYLDLYELDKSNEECVFLVNPSYLEYESSRNDFLVVSNPKYKFCVLESEFSFPSKLQLDYLKEYSKGDISVFCKESIIGDNCIFDRGCIIGGEDFSPVLADDGHTLVQFPQLGGVKIGDGVVVKYNSMIGKGTFGYTTIGDNTMIDYGCQIGHNCIIGKSCIIAAGTIIGGSTIIEDSVVIGIGARIRNGIKIGAGASIGMGSVVIRDVPANCVVVGNPAHTIKHDKIMSEKGLV